MSIAQKHARSSGFTIVELLIVIVVIAILAAITIVAYNGIQQRARNTQRIAAAKEWLESIKEYAVANQAYPASISTYCIGESNITNLDANPDVDCGVSNNVKHSSASETPAFNAGIKTIRSSIPNFPGAAVDIDAGLKGSGMLFRADTYDPTGENITNYPTLIFFLEGSNQDCVLQPLVNAGLGGNFTKTTSKNSYPLPLGTACRVMLPDPTKL